MTNELKQPTSRRFQYSLPSLMLFVLVCSLVFAGVGAFYRRMERERQAITEIVKAEGVCDVSHSPLGSILMLDVSGTQVTDLSPLTELRSLVWLEVDGTQVSDLAPLAELTSLHGLSLGGTQVSDLTPLARLKNLQELYLEGTPVSDEQVVVLQRALPNCRIFGPMRTHD